MPTDADRAYVSVLPGWFRCNSTVNLPLRYGSAFYLLLLAGVFDFQNAVLSTNFGSTGRLHYFSAAH